MKKLIKEFEEAKQDLIKIINSFPEEKREKTLFDKWSLKNLLSHLTGWGNYQISTLKQFKRGAEPIVPKSLKSSINDVFVSKRSPWSWNKVYDEFLRISQDLIDEYRGLPGKLWKKEIWKNKKTTPQEFIKIEINHYRKTHGHQIKRILKSL